MTELARPLALEASSSSRSPTTAPTVPAGAHPWYFWNLKVVPSVLDGVRVLKGCEANIVARHRERPRPARRRSSRVSTSWPSASTHGPASTSRRPGPQHRGAAAGDGEPARRPDHSSGQRGRVPARPRRGRRGRRAAQRASSSSTTTRFDAMTLARSAPPSASASSRVRPRPPARPSRSARMRTTRTTSVVFDSAIAVAESARLRRGRPAEPLVRMRTFLPPRKARAAVSRRWRGLELARCGGPRREWGRRVR